MVLQRMLLWHHHHCKPRSNCGWWKFQKKEEKKKKMQFWFWFLGISDFNLLLNPDLVHPDCLPPPSPSLPNSPCLLFLFCFVLKTFQARSKFYPISYLTKPKTNPKEEDKKKTKDKKLILTSVFASTSSLFTITFLALHQTVLQTFKTWPQWLD